MGSKLRSANSSGLDSNFAVLEADRVFGQPSEWSGPVPQDVESGLGACACIPLVMLFLDCRGCSARLCKLLCWQLAFG